MKFLDVDGTELTQEEKEAKDTTEGRFLQDLSDYDIYRWSPWATVPPREEETPPSATELDLMEAQVMYTALMTDTLLPEEE